MDPGFFANPDPGFKSPDPSINKLMGWDLNDGFDKVLTKKDSVKSARYELKHFFLLLLQF